METATLPISDLVARLPRLSDLPRKAHHVPAQRDMSCIIDLLASNTEARHKVVVTLRAFARDGRCPISRQTLTRLAIALEENDRVLIASRLEGELVNIVVCRLALMQIEEPPPAARQIVATFCRGQMSVQTLIAYMRRMAADFAVTLEQTISDLLDNPSSIPAN